MDGVTVSHKIFSDGLLISLIVTYDCEWMVCLAPTLVIPETYGAIHWGNTPQTQAWVRFEPTTRSIALVPAPSEYKIIVLVWFERMPSLILWYNYVLAII